MAKVRDLRDFYKSSSRSCNGKSPEKVPTFLTSASGTVNGAEINAINKEMKAFVQPKTKKKYSSVPSNITNEVGEYAKLSQVNNFYLKKSSHFNDKFPLLPATMIFLRILY